MPCRLTVIRWLADDPVFCNQYARARELQADAIFDDMLDIADDGRNDFIEGKRGAMVVDSEAVQRSRLRVDTRKWIASKLNPKKYGDKQEIEHSGSIQGRIEVFQLPSNGR